MLFLKLETVPAIILPGLSEEEKKALVIADDRLAELAGWDREILKAELDGLSSDFDLDLIGFDTPDLDRVFAADFSATSDAPTESRRA